MPSAAPFVFAFLSLAVPSLFAASPNSPFSIAQVMSAPFASTPVASPTGAKVAWVENVQGKRNVWLAEAPQWTGQPVTAFTLDDGQEIDDLAWSPDGSYLLFARGGDFEHVGTANPNPNWSALRPPQQIWYVAIDKARSQPPEPKVLAEGHAPCISSTGAVAFLRGGQIFTLKLTGDSRKAEAKNAVSQMGQQESLHWSPDGSELAFVSARGNHSFIGVYNPYEDKLRYLDPSADRDSEPVWSPDGTRLAYVRIPAGGRAFGPSAQREGEPWSIRVANVKTGLGRQVFKASAGAGSVFHGLASETQLFWTIGDRLVFPWEHSGWSHLYSLSVNGDAPRELTPGDGEVEQAALSRDGSTIYFSTNLTDVDRRHLLSVNPAGGSAPKALTSGEQIEMSPTWLADGAFAYLSSSFNQRSSPMLRLSTGQTKALAADIVPADFPASQLVKPQPVLITAADGMPIRGQLFLPPRAKAGERHPALVFFHGGSRRQMLLGFHYRPYYSNAYSLNEYFASQGYVVLSVNYRSGIGYGLNFREALNYGASGGSEMNDVIGAGLYLKNRPDVESNHIGVWGGSYGGYLTAMALSRASDLFAAGVDFHGVHDWSTLRDAAAPPSGGDPKPLREYQEALRVAFESSPMASVDGWRSPVLLIHGDDDRNVAFSQSVVLVEALRQRHVDFEQMILPNEIHDFLMHRSWVSAYEACADFFARKLH